MLKPEILTHPNIPKPLHGLSPRTIMGEQWWNTTRQQVYKSTEYHCIACGVHKKDAKKYNWLEAHEYWEINYDNGICKVISLEPLCHYCHNFIHSGRLHMIMGKEKSKNEVMEILEHGLKILFKNNLKCFPFTHKFATDLGCYTNNIDPYIIKINPNLSWNEWVLIFEGKEYRSKFKSYEEWKLFYSKPKLL